MKTQLIAALLISGVVIASPAFAGNNASDAPFQSYTNAGASTQTRADVNTQLVAAVQNKSAAPQGNSVAPAASAIARLAPAPAVNLLNRERP